MNANYVINAIRIKIFIISKLQNIITGEMKTKSEVIRSGILDMLNHIDDHKEGYIKGNWTNESISETWAKGIYLKLFPEIGVIEPDNEKTYLFYEGEKYYFGQEYEFCSFGLWNKCKLHGFDERLIKKFKTLTAEYIYIRKIDHTSKYKKQLEELKKQADKDGVNL